MATSGSSDDGGDGSQFLTSGSSALILSFLAIGLFVGGLLVMLAMRRYVFLSWRRTGRWASEPAGQWNWDDATYENPPPFAIGMSRVRRQRDFGEKPRIFEPRLVRAAGIDWQDIMPISAQATARHQQDRLGVSSGPREAGHQQHAAAVSGYLHPFSVGVRDFVAQVRPAGRVRARSPSPPPLFSPALSAPRQTGHVPPPPPSPLESNTLAALADPTSLRVSVAILLPGQQYCAGDVPLYALGVADVMWSGGPLDDLRRDEG